MHIKDKLAALRRRLAFKLAVLLRRWAFKLDHKRMEPSYGDGLYLPSLSSFGLVYYKIHRLENAYRVSLHELRQVREYELRGYPEARTSMMADYRERIAASIVKGLIEHDIIKFKELHDEVTQDLTIRGSLYVGISEAEKEHNNPNKNSERC